MPFLFIPKILGRDRDIEIIEALRKHTDSVFRIDANAAWKKEEALEKIRAFEKLGVEFIEQPLAKDDWEGMKWLSDKSPLPLYADESCVVEQDVEKMPWLFSRDQYQANKMQWYHSGSEDDPAGP